MKPVEDLKPLTSLRFVAAMMIVLLHAKQYFPQWTWLAHVPAIAVHGVSFFFVLSGFILSHVYRSRPMPGYGRFILTRFARLWPVHLFALIVLVSFVRPDSVTFDGPGIFSKWAVLPINLAMLQSAVPTISYIFSWNSVSWSISTEFFFYLAFPLLLLNIEKTWHWKLFSALVVALSIGPLLTALGVPAASDSINDATMVPVVYASPLGRGFEFCLGMSAWVIWNKYLRHRELTLAAWSLIEASALLLLYLWSLKFAAIQAIVPASTSLWFSTTGSAIPFAILITLIASARGVVGKALSARSFVMLGQISFSIYMLHQILMKIFVFLPPPYVTEWTVFGTLFVAAVFSFNMVEKPGQALINQLATIRPRRLRDC